MKRIGGGHERIDVHISVHPGDAGCGVRAEFGNVNLYWSYVKANELCIKPVLSCVKYPCCMTLGDRVSEDVVVASPQRISRLTTLA